MLEVPSVLGRNSLNIRKYAAVWSVCKLKFNRVEKFWIATHFLFNPVEFLVCNQIGLQPLVINPNNQTRIEVHNTKDKILKVKKIN